MDLIPNYFFLGRKLYKKIRVVKTENYVVAWSYQDESRMRFNYSSVRQEASRAFKLSEVSDLIGRSQKEIKSYINRNLIDKPSGRLYSVKNRTPGQYMWSEQDVLDLREVIFELVPKNKYGEPYVNFRLISKAELISKLKNDATFYIRNENGEFVKIWRAL